VARGDRREPIYQEEGDRLAWLDYLGQVCGRTGWRVYGWVLMENHYHLLVETPGANLVSGMQWLQTAYTVWFNRRHGLSGHLFGARCKAVLIDEGEPQDGTDLGRCDRYRVDGIERFPRLRSSPAMPVCVPPPPAAAAEGKPSKPDSCHIATNRFGGPSWRPPGSLSVARLTSGTSTSANECSERSPTPQSGRPAFLSLDCEPLLNPSILHENLKLSLLTRFSRVF